MVKIKLDKVQMDELKKFGVDTSKAQLDGFTLSELIEMMPENPYKGEIETKFEFVVKKAEAAWIDKNGGVCLAANNGEVIDLVYQLLIIGLEAGYIKPNNKE